MTTTTTQTATETLSFQADIAELMNLIINAFYSNRDVFLRELISNASDAIEKRRLGDLKQGILDTHYKIRVSADPEAKVLTIEDNGIGMDREDLIRHLSTIARSGTKEFVRQCQQQETIDNIGQFGVGFYSIFLVADRAEVYTRKASQENSPLLLWSSDAKNGFSIQQSEDAILETGGTRIRLYLKEDAGDYLEEKRLRGIISTHSAFVAYPIELWTTIEEEVETKKEEEEEEEDAEDAKVEELEEEKKEGDTVKEKIVRNEWEIINTEKAVWSRQPSDVQEEEYKTLYKTLTKDFQDPFYYRHFTTEGALESRGVLYIPTRAPFDPTGDQNRDKRRIKLYVKKVLVLDELDKDMLPDWMSFVVGVIDSPDVPLNVSREMLQQTRVLKALKTQLKKQVLQMLTTLLEEEPEKYNRFYEQYQRHIKLGIHEGDESLVRFLRVPVDKREEVITVDDYIDQYLKKEEEEEDKSSGETPTPKGAIYYNTGEQAVENPMTRLYIRKGYHVLLFTEPIDEFMLQRLHRYKEYDLIHISKDHDCPWKDENETTAELEEETSFCQWIKDTLKDDSLESVKVSKTLTTEQDAPCSVLSTKYGWTGNMEKIMQSQPLQDPKGMKFMKGRKIFTINPGHPIIRDLHKTFLASKSSSSSGEEEEKKEDTFLTPSSVVIDRVRLLYTSYVLAAGFPVSDTISFAGLVDRVLTPQEALT